MPIRRLDPLLVDRIAAGEVIERPAAAVKELIENALDAGAAHVEVAIEAGGRGLIRVADDGRGMDEGDLSLSVERHATSKLPDGDLTAISTFGFRGEALPSIASVSRLEIRTRMAGAPTGLKIVVEDGRKSAVAPCGQPFGTRVEARDLFAATPARLKFLKTDRAEAQAVSDAVKRLALSRPETRFTLMTDIGAGFDWPPCGEGGRAERLRQALGDDFAANSLPLEAAREGVRLAGRIGLPTFSRPNALQQFVFVNGRAVRDKSLAGALRAAYLDFLPADRHAVAALFVECDPSEVDVNVHPAKAEVRFRDSGLVRGLVVGAIKQRLGEALHRATTTGGTATVIAMRPPAPLRPAPLTSGWDWRASPAAPNLAANLARGFSEPAQASFAAFAPAAPAPAAEPAERDLAAPLGAARAQVHGNYIIAQTADGLVIVDQHAAHERIVYEELKRQREGQGVERQALLTPLVVDLDPDAAALIEAQAEELASLGLVVEGFGPGAVLIREAPAVIAQGDLAGLVRDLAADLSAEDGAQSLARRLDQRLATFACHHSVRSGRPLRPEEMNALLRAMETTPGAGQCNHGRPTYVELKLSDIERLFGRR